MNAREFFEAVAELRKYQKTYERSRGKDQFARRGMVDLEQRIDKEIARVKVLTREESSPRLDL